MRNNFYFINFLKKAKVQEIYFLNLRKAFNNKKFFTKS